MNFLKWELFSGSSGILRISFKHVSSFLVLPAEQLFLSCFQCSFAASRNSANGCCTWCPSTCLLPWISTWGHTCWTPTVTEYTPRSTITCTRICSRSYTSSFSANISRCSFQPYRFVVLCFTLLPISISFAVY